MSEIIIGMELGADELGMNSGTGVGFGVSEGVSSNDSSPSQPFGTPPTIELPLAPPEELLEGSNTFTVDGQGGTAVLPKPAIKVEDAPRSQTPVPEVVYVQNGFGGGMVALGVDSEAILASLSLEKLSDGTFAYVKANKRLYYLSDRLLTGVGTKTGSCRWLRVPAGEDSLSFLTEAQVISMMESTDSYNRTKWVGISADIDKLRVEYGQATTYLDGKYEQNRSLFEQTATSIRADVSSYKRYADGKIIDQNSQLLILSNQISTKVSSTEFNPLLGRMVQAESSIIQNAADIRLKASQSVVDALGTRLSSAEIAIDGANANILLKAEKSVVDALGTRLSSAEIAINGANANILLKAEKSVVDALGTRLTSAEVNIDGAAGKINLLTSRSDGHDTKFAAITIDSAYGIQLIGEKVVFSSGKTLLHTMDDKVAPATDAANAAKSIADQAKEDALTANTKLASISDDNKLVEVEKSTVIMEYTKIINEQAGIDTQLTAYGVTIEKVSYDSAITALTTYLNTLTAPKAWNDISGETNINGVTFRTKFNNVYQARQVALNAVYAKAKTIADSAITRLNDIDSDNSFTPNEKIALRTDWEKIVVEKAKLEAMADTFSVTTEKATYQAKFSALGTYLNGGTTYVSGVPLWINDSNLSVTTVITGTTLRTRIAEYGDAASSLLRACTDKARVSANTANAAITDIATDNIITPSEKRTVLLQYSSILNEQAQLDNEALNYGITTEKVSYDSAITALTSYLNSLTTPVAWNNVSGNTNVDGPTLRTKFANVYTTRGTLLGMMYHNARSYSETLDTNTRNAMAQNLGYDDYNAFYTDAITNGKTIIKGGYLQTSLIDTDAIMAKELVASNMIVKGGRIGDFTVNNKLIGDGYTNGALNGNQIMLDPSNNEIVLAKNGAKRVRLTNNELTGLALLQVDGGTKYCTTGTTVSSTVTDNALLASKNSLGVGGAGLSKTTYAGINGVTPQLSSLVANITKVPLSSGFYSMDVPYAFNIVHNGKKGDNNTYHRITGTNSAIVTVRLMNAAGVVKSSTDSLTLKVDTEKTGASPVFYGTARFNFAVSAADSYWVEATITVVGGSERPIRYQSWNSGNAFSSGYWSEQYNMNLQYELSLRPGMTIDGSIGLTEISNSGIQSVWTPSRYIRIDGNTGNNVFIESKGVWMHNGYTIDFNPETLKTSIGFDPANFATKNYVDTNFYNTAQSDGRYLGINATAADSAKLGGQLPSYYSAFTHNHDSVYLGINATAADSNKLGGQLPNYYYNSTNLNRSDVDFVANGIIAASGAFTGNLTAHSGSQVWDASNLNRSDTDFVAKKLYGIGIGTYYNVGGDSDLRDTNEPWYGLGRSGSRTTLTGYYGIDIRAKESSINLYGTTNVTGGIYSDTYSGSGFTATGWGITQDGDANFRNHTVRGKLTTYEFVQNKISIANGNMIVSDNAKISGKVDWWNDGNTIRLILDGTYNPFRGGDRIKCQSNGKSYELTVGWNNIAEGTSTPFIDVNCVEIGGNSVPAIGDFLVRWNSTDAARKGLLYLCSSDAGSPNYQVIYDGAVKAQFGNLEGRSWLGATLPANTWGLWAENAYLSGAVNATSGKIGGMTILNGELQSSKNGNRYNFINASYIGTYDSSYGFINVFANDGSGSLAKGNIAWDTAGNVTFSDSVKLQWQSGGRNLLPNSKRKPDAQAFGSSTYNTDGTWTITDSTGWNVWEYAVPYQVGEAYTISIKCKRLSGTGGIEVYFREGDGYIYIPNSENIGNNWKVVSVTRVIQGNNTSGNNNLYFHFPIGSIQVEYIKIEKGYNATDWTPALEDVDSKLTRIGPDGIYTGKIKAENIEGDVLIGKTIRATNTADKVTLEFHGKAGTITGFSDSGIVLSQLTRNSLTFNDDNGIPGVFLRNGAISLSECKNGGSVYVDSAGSIPLGDKTAMSNQFTISNVGVYKGTTTFNFSGSLDVSAIGTNAQTIVECGLTVATRADLEWYNTSTGLWESYIEGVCNCIYDRTSSTRSLSFDVTNIPASFSFTTAKTGTFRFRFSHTMSSWGRAWNKLDIDEIFDVEVNYITSVAVNGGAMSGSKLSNGTYIGNNGFISYNGTGDESFIVFDKSKGDFQFRVQANSEVCSLNKAIKLSINESGVDVIISGTTKLRVNNSGRIFIYGAPAVSTTVDGTGTNRYRLYLDEYNQLCRSPNNGW